MRRIYFFQNCLYYFIYIKIIIRPSNTIKKLNCKYEKVMQNKFSSNIYMQNNALYAIQIPYLQKDNGTFSIIFFLVSVFHLIYKILTFKNEN